MTTTSVPSVVAVTPEETAELTRRRTPSPQSDSARRHDILHQLTKPSPRPVLRLISALIFGFISVTAIVWHRRGPVGIDTFLLHGYIARKHTLMFSIASVLTDLASPAAVTVLGTVIAGYLWRYRHDTARALVCLGAPLAAGAAEATLKIIVERLRPATGALTGEYGFGFPSGHTAGFTALAFAIALTISRKRTRATTIALLLSVTIAATRVLVGAHYPTDVLGGLLLGIAIAAATSLLRALIENVFDVTSEDMDHGLAS